MSIEKATLFGKSFVARFNIFVAASWCFTKIKRPSKKLFVLNLSHCSYQWRGGFFWNYFLPEIKKGQKCTFSSIWQVNIHHGKVWGGSIHTYSFHHWQCYWYCHKKSEKSRQRHFELNARPNDVFWHHVLGVVTLLLGDKVVHLNVQLTPFIPSSTGD